MNAIIPRNSVHDIVAARDAAINAYHAAFDRIADADACLREAAALWNAAAGDFAGKPSGDRAPEVEAFFNAVRLPDREQWLRTVTRLVDISVWHHLVRMTELESIMDRTAKEQLYSSLKWVPERLSWRRDSMGELINPEEIQGIPPVTEENVLATIEKWAGEAELVFRRGIAEAFSSLDRRFRSHDGFKVGSRLILTYFADEWGSVKSWGRQADTLRDIERTFLVLDGRSPRASYAGILGQIEHERRGGFSPRQSEHVGEYFRVVIYKNGNAHLWFTRADLVKKVNHLLAEYYGEVIGDGQTREDDLRRNIKTTPARHFGFFPTPDAAADLVLQDLPLYQRKEARPLTVLEPSAGTGNLARRCVFNEQPKSDRWGRMQDMVRRTHVDCVEIQPHLAEALRTEGIYRRVWCEDFLNMSPAVTGLYDRIVMNPPFDLERDIDHVVHALDFLEPDGILLAIMSAGTEFRETRKSIAFRSLMERMGARFRDLPPRAFAESGTNVNTTYVLLRKP